MLDCKAMTSPMSTSLKLLNDDTLETIDATLYKDIIGSLVYLINTIPDMFCCKHTKSVHGESQAHSPNRRKTCDEVCKGNFRLWA